jgi:DNA topoisomerase-1
MIIDISYKMSKYLVIVESGGKIDKISKILNSLGKDKYNVLASYGHVYGLETKNMGIDFDNDFKPTYVTNPDGASFRAKAIKAIKDTASKVDEVILASDADREGAFIAWSIAHMLKLKKPKRIIFHEISKDAISKAIKNPEDIDMNTVRSQEARRILDRIIGYSISPVLQKNININARSAGRCQSACVRIVKDREDEIEVFFKGKAEDGNASSYFKTIGTFSSKKKAIKLQKCGLYKLTNGSIDKYDEGDELKGKVHHFVPNVEYSDNDDEKVKRNKEVLQFLKRCGKAEFKVQNISNKTTYRNPSPPFTTSTLQQEASRKFRFNAKTTMSHAQKLYEKGLITYMRSDSVALSEDAMKNIKEYVVEEYGNKYYNKKEYKTKSKNAQEAHEAVRCVDASIVDPEDVTAEEAKLYSLIWKRTVASQMAPAEIKHTLVQIVSDQESIYYLMADLQTITFLGFLKVYNITTVEKDDEEEDDDALENNVDENKLPSVGDVLVMKYIISSEEYHRPPTRYNESALLKKLEEKGIGRPSTYAPIVAKVLERNYVEKKDIPGVKRNSTIYNIGENIDGIEQNTKEILLGNEKNKYVVTPLGVTVTKFLLKYFPDIMDYKYTANMEEDLDKIAEGDKVWTDVLHEFYDDFKPTIDEMQSGAFKSEFNNVLGIHPDTGEEIIATIAKFGPVVKMYDSNTEKYKYGKIKEPLTIESITLEEAVSLLDTTFPYYVGEYEKKTVEIQKGQHGLYIKYNNNNYSIDPITEDMLEAFNLEDAIKIMDEKKTNVINKFKIGKKEYNVLNGQYGPYIQTMNGKKRVNIKIPYGYKADELTGDQLKEIISKQKDYKSKKTNTKSDKSNKANDKKTTKANDKKTTKTNNKKKLAPKKNKTLSSESLFVD